MAHPEVEKLTKVVTAARQLVKPNAILIREAVEQAEADEIAGKYAATDSSQATE